MRGLEIVKAYSAGFLITAGLSMVAFDAQAVRYENIEVKVTPGTDTVSPGRAGTYSFYIANGTNGTINSVRFRAYLDVGEFAFSNPISAGAPTTCTRVSPQAIDCTITGSLASYGYSTFDFAFTAPTSGTQVALNWDVRFGQGEATNYISTTTTPGLTPTYISLITNSTTEAKAYIPPLGDNLYTGTAIPTANDLFTVGVVVDPAGNKVITAAILEQACVQPTNKCAKLDVFRIETLPTGDLIPYRAEYTDNPLTTDLDKRLVIVLRLAAVEVAGKNINQAAIFYTSDDGLISNQQVLACPKRDPNYVPAVTDPPCLASRVAFTKRTAPTPELIGAWEFTLYAAKNGFVDVGY